jgi:CPA1 family monovalent cation:H+ antiporter
MSATSFFALFIFLCIASGVFFLAKRLKVPYTVLLVAAGLFLVPLSEIPLFSFIKDFTLTPELLFYIFLPILLFESSYNINTRLLSRNMLPVLALAVGSLLISAFFVGGALWWALSLVGFPIPFILALLFGALISATDPVAVLALFKEFGAPRHLTLIFEGESLANDATSVALFLIVLGVALHGFHGAETMYEGVVAFLTMMTGGVVIGAFMGWLFSKLIIASRSNEVVSITLMIAVAHLTFILSELISHHTTFFGSPVTVSGIIATVVASIILGNYARYSISPKAEEFVDKFWSQFAFLANSVVFLLVGLLFASLHIPLELFLVPIVLAVLIVAAGRALSVYPVLGLTNFFLKERVPAPWQHLLAWGSLRGALAVTMVLLVPDTLSFAGWPYDFTPKEFLMGLTIGCIYATLFLKATTIGPMIKKLKIDALTDIEKVERAEGLALVHTKALRKIEEYHPKEYVPEAAYQKIKERHEGGLAALNAQAAERSGGTSALSENVARIYALGIEHHYLKELYAFGEITYPVYRRIIMKLQLQLEQVERGAGHYDALEDPEMERISVRRAQERAPRLADMLLEDVSRTEETYMYYRAQMVIAKKVVKELGKLGSDQSARILTRSALEETQTLYERYAADAKTQMHAVALAHPDAIAALNDRFAEQALNKVETKVLDELYEREMITPKLRILLTDELRREAGLKSA